MPRGKNTNVFLICKEKLADGKTCNMQNYNMRLNKKTRTKEEVKKFCAKCNKHALHVSGSEIKHSSGK